MCGKVFVESDVVGEMPRYRVTLKADARKLNSSDQKITSPRFCVWFPGISFSMMLCPKSVGTGKKQASLRMSKGFGFVELKCTSDPHGVIANVQWRARLGQEKPYPFVSHNF